MSKQTVIYVGGGLKKLKSLPSVSFDSINIQPLSAKYEIKN